MANETIKQISSELETIKVIIQHLNAQYALTRMNAEKKIKEPSMLLEIHAATKAITIIGKKINLLHHGYMHPAPRNLN